MATAAAASIGTIKALNSASTFASPASADVSYSSCAAHNSSSLASACKWRRASVSTGAEGFFDQGHLQFYVQAAPKKFGRKSKSNAAPQSGLRLMLFQAVGGSLEAEVADGLRVCSEQPNVSEPRVSDGLNICFENVEAVKDAMKQLEALEDEIRAKKKSLKAKKKEMKAEKKSKKERKCESSSSSSESDEVEDEIVMDKMKMQSHDSKEMKQKKKEAKVKVKCERKSPCDSAASSSSESSDCEDEMSMDQFRMQLPKPALVEPKADFLTAPISQIQQLPAQTISCSPLTVSMEDIASYDVNFAGLGSVVVESSANYVDMKSTGQVEVCTGGKCRKDGSQQVLSAFQELIPSTTGVSVSACKCMGKCGKGPNVRVYSREADSLPQVYTAVSEEDAKFLSHYHFGVSPEHGIAVISVPMAEPVVPDTSIYTG